MAEADKQYTASYQHAGAGWALQFWASDDDDAQRKIVSIRRSLIYDGRVVLVVRVPRFSLGRLKFWG